jgi:hypothetical protein
VARHPLTHHEILGLIEPFTRRGLHVDLAASNRIERRLLFKPILHEEEAAELAGASEVLQLESPDAQTFRLVRVVTLAGGATAKLTAEGESPGKLLERIEAVPLQRQFAFVGDILVARNYRVAPASEAADAPMLLTLVSAQARLDGLTLDLKADTGRGYPAEIELSAQPGHALALPDDVLAALGWNWRVLRPSRSGWSGALRAPKREPERSRRVESAMETAVAHLARTLAEPPRQFHDRLARARWGVVFRRLIPVLGATALMLFGLALTFLHLPQDSIVTMIIFHSPPLLLFGMFAMRELPRFEIPPLPRPSSAPSWVVAPEGGKGGA